MTISKKLLLAGAFSFTMQSGVHASYDAFKLHYEVLKISFYVESHGFNSRTERFVGSWLLHKINSHLTTENEIVTISNIIDSHMSLEEINKILHRMAKEDRRLQAAKEDRKLQ